MDETARLIQLAAEYLESARADRAARRLYAAFEAARHAAELSAKAILLDTVGEYPKRHDVGRDLFQAGAVPATVDPTALDAFLARYLVGRYGDYSLTDEDVRQGLLLAERMVESARSRHPR